MERIDYLCSVNNHTAKPYSEAHHEGEKQENNKRLMEYKTILSGLFERLSGFRQKRPYAGQKYELMGITAELIDVICQLRDDVLRRFSQEAVIDLDLDVDYGQLAEQALQAELPDGLEGWDSKMSEDLTHTEIVSRLEGDLSESFPQMITQMDNLRLQQLAMVTNETLGELNSVLLKIADAKVRPHRDEEYARLFESEKRRYMNSGTSGRSKQEYEEWKNLTCHGMPTIEDAEDYRICKLLKMFEKGVFKDRVDQMKRLRPITGEIDFDQIEGDDEQKRIAAKNYKVFRNQVADYEDGYLKVNPIHAGQYFFACRYDPNAKSNRTNILKYVHQIHLVQEEHRRLLETKEETDINETTQMPSPQVDAILFSDKARHYWLLLQEAGFVDAQWRLTAETTRKQAMYIAEAFAVKIGLKSKWKPFEVQWDVKNLAQEKWDMQQTGAMPQRYQEIDLIFDN